jgi:hypothetical protein
VDEYFQFTIKEDFENYISEIIAEVFPIHKVYANYSSNPFEGFDKNSSLEEVLKEYEEKDINFNFYVNVKSSRNLDIENVENSIEELAMLVLSRKYRGCIIVNALDEDYYDAVINNEAKVWEHTVWHVQIFTRPEDEGYTIKYKQSK